MKRILSAVNGKLLATNNSELKNDEALKDKIKFRNEYNVKRHKKESFEFSDKLLPPRPYSANKVRKKFRVDIVIQESNNEIENDFNPNNKAITKKEYFNRLSIERINFKFEEYELYPEINFKPSIFFFKFLCIKPESRRESMKKIPKLKLYIPDTIVKNDSEPHYWIYTDETGGVVRVEQTNDSDIIEKFKSTANDPNELISVFKAPNVSNDVVDDNLLKLLNIEELERYLYSKHPGPFALQKFIKCRGPKAFVCRSVWRKGKPSYVYILTNKANYNDISDNQYCKYVVNSKNNNSYYSFFASSGKHLDETIVYMNNIVKFIESHSDLIFEEIAGDFLKDEAGIWWLINIKALKIKNISKFRNPIDKQYISKPKLEFFVSQRHNDGLSCVSKLKKFDYQTKIKCKFCGLEFIPRRLKYNLTTKMILETDLMLKHIGINMNFIERPDLKHIDSSIIYLPYRVCEDCYLLFETMNEVKNSQISIANYFKIPVDDVNFGVEIYTKENSDEKAEEEEKTLKNIMTSLESSKIQSGKINTNDNIYSHNLNQQHHTNLKNNDSSNNENNLNIASNNSENFTIPQRESKNYLYRFLIMFTDIFWNENIPIPNEQLYLLFNIFGNWYKIKLIEYYSALDYYNINFFKMFYIVCDETHGFIEYIDKNRQMLVKIGYFVENPIREKELEMAKIFKKEIIIEDLDICNNYDEFVQFSSVELSLSAVRYADKYRNTLNGLLFKEEKPHYVGKLRCLIRVNKEKEIDVEKINCRKHFNFSIPPVNFVISEELPEYWLELVERNKLRINILKMILNTIKKYNLKYDKKKHKEEVFLKLETIVSDHLNSKKK